MKKIKTAVGYLALIFGLVLFVRLITEYFTSPIVADFANKAPVYGFDLTTPGIMILAVGFLIFTFVFIVLAVVGQFKNDKK